MGVGDVVSGENKVKHTLENGKWKWVLPKSLLMESHLFKLRKLDRHHTAVGQNEVVYRPGRAGTSAAFAGF